MLGWNIELVQMCVPTVHVETPALSGEGDWGSDKQRAIVVTMPPAAVMEGVWTAEAQYTEI